MTEFYQHLLNLAVSALVAYLVWRHYSARSYPPEERYSTFWPRFFSGFADSCALWPAGVLFFFVLSFGLPNVVVVLVRIAEHLVWLLYAVVMHGLYGQTVGKMTTRVRVVDCQTEGPILALSLVVMGWDSYLFLTGTADVKDFMSGKAGLEKGSFWILNSLPGLRYLAEVVTMFPNEKRRALHDFIAGTVVVRTNIDGITLAD